ncbi:putative amidohydrolase YtcJ [Variovorax sp. TBS-050B]|uniref:amidohydrolase n=1 Tax=Variovorax sp. TBS-050B TaxID=2940551 RepID=UPI002474E655|nr:amidohydrolase [Variovorax sp. TBS-050B]MDH6592169.1 putative amidohydrolase YtcJ [Variovorax sp. TBS-050B]
MRRALLAALAAFAAAALPCGAAQAQPADLVVTHAKIATLDAAGTMAEALAVRDGRIVAVGSAAQVRALAGPATRSVDAGGRTVIPGLIDSHMHAVRAALSYSTEVNWIGAATIAEAMARLRAAAARARPGGWLIVAGGWTEQQFAERRRPTVAELQQAAPDHPVYVQLFYEAVAMTPRALEAMGVAPDTLPAGMKAAPDGAPGWMTGDIVGISALFDKLPKPTYDDNLAGTRAFFTELNRLGITGLVDPGGFSIAPSQYAALFELWRRKALTLRVAYSVFAQKPGAELQEFRELTQMLPMGFGDDMLRFNGLGERVTLAMYNNNFPDAAAKEKFYELIRWAAARGLAVTIHWQENGSVDHLLALYEKLDAEVPIRQLRWSIAHLDDASPQTLARMKALGMGWTMQDAMYFQGDRALATRGEAARRMPPIGTALRMGLNVGAGTDAHRVASYNPFVALQWMLDGRTVSGTPMRGPDELPTREQALRLYTAGSAWFSFDEAKRGTLEVGKLADFAVLDQDFFSVPVERIAKTASLMTVVGGRVVYAAPPFGAAP